jgi:1-acyl-sn-glycerol-3-phosphate acyltransferase
MAALFVLHTGRTPRFLGERNLWKIPGAAPLLDAVGTIPGAPDDAVKLLSAGELVCVYPGGIDDSFKVSSEAYKLQWSPGGKARAGFARVALRAGAPIVPIAATGIDELFEIPRREGLLGRLLLGSRRYDMPLPKALTPRRVPLDYHALTPVEPRGDASDPEAVERMRRATYEALESVLAPYRERLERAPGGRGPSERA